MNFGSVITAMITPFKDDGKVNYDKAQELAAFLMENGSDSIVVTGTTGEASTLSLQEKAGLYKAVKEAVGNNGFVIANTGDNETATSVFLTKEAEKIRVDGVLAVVPYYNKPPQEGMFRHFKAIAESTDLPVMLYNVPSRTSSNLLPEKHQFDQRSKRLYGSSFRVEGKASGIYCLFWGRLYHSSHAFFRLLWRSQCSIPPGGKGN